VLFDDLEPKDTIASVLVPVAVPVAYTYKVPAGHSVVPGTIVRVPLGTREVIGAVWDGEPDAAINPNKLKSISHVYDTTPPLDKDLRRFVDWVAGWTLGAPGMVVRMVLRSEEALEPEAPVPGVRRI
jgi:primosomal protein N' (replication factor Y)